MVGLGGFEPPTSPLSGVRSNQLSYRPLISITIIFGLLVFFFSFYNFYQTTCVNTRTFLKEVIQPHLPVGLPCYDFTPVMNHTVVTVLTKLD